MTQTDTTDVGRYLGIDFGTSGCRAIVIDQNKKIIATAVSHYESCLNQNNRHEQPAELWWNSFIELMTLLSQQLELNTILNLSLDATSGTVLLIDSNGTPISNALMYNDCRAQLEAQKINKLVTQKFAVLDASSGLAKMLWLHHNISLHQDDRFCHQADWLIGQLTGNYAISDFNNTLKSGFDIQNMRWPDWINQLGIQAHQLPEVVAPSSNVGLIKKSIAQQTGLSEQLLIKTGCTDSTAAVIATGANNVGDAVTSLGSTLVVKIISDDMIFDTNYGVYSQPYQGKYLVGGASNSGAAVLKYFFNETQMQEMSSNINLKSNTGLNYYPLLQNGERFPINDPNHRAKISPRPKDDTEFFKALLEGITDIEKLAYQRLESLGSVRPNQIFTMGGGAKNLVWTKMRETELQIPIFSAPNTEAAYGAALLALGL